MQVKSSHKILLAVLALIFTIELTFATVEVPRLADSFLQKNVPALDIDSHVSGSNLYRTELYIEHYRIRLVGYLALGVILLLIIYGFVSNKTGFASIGAVALFLPAFGHFALTMFFLAGLGLLYSAWLPFLDISLNIFHAGDIVFLPYHWLVSLFAFLGIQAGGVLPFIIVGFGLFLFLSATLTWMYVKFENKEVADFWIYRFSRHPQYLGWIIWSYGMILLPGNAMKKSWEISAGLPWLISTVIIIGVAMLEELKMQKKYQEKYEFYRIVTPFLFPLPKIVTRIISLPLHIFTEYRYPTRRRHIVGLLAFYTVLLTTISILFVYESPAVHKPVLSEDNVDQTKFSELVSSLETATERRTKYFAAMNLAAIGDSAIEPLTRFTAHPDPEKREFALQALVSLETNNLTELAVKALEDLDADVRYLAVSILGESNCQEAASVLIPKLNDMSGLVRCNTAKCLLKLGVASLDSLLIESLDDEFFYMRVTSAELLGKLKTTRALPHLGALLRDKDARVRRAAVLALANYESTYAREILTTALEDPDWEVRFYANSSLKKWKNILD